MEISKNDSSLEEGGLEIPLELVAMKVELAVVQQRCSMRGLAQVGQGGGWAGTGSVVMDRMGEMEKWFIPYHGVLINESS